MSSVPSPATVPATDALEQRDPWRDAWQAVTHDVLVAALCLIVALAVAAGTLLPQTPTGGTSDPLAYSQWQTQARSAAGVLFDSASMLSLFTVAQAFWLRVVMAALMVVLALRLMDRVSRLWSARVRTGDLRDEVRVWVTSDAPALSEMAQLARNMRYRLTQSTPLEPPLNTMTAQWLVIDRSPIAEACAIVLHVGLLITLAGIMLNMVSGWDVARQQVDTESMSVLPYSKLGLQLVSVDDTTQTATLHTLGTQQTLALTVGARGQPVWSAQTPLPCCLSVRLNELIPGYHVSAKDSTGKGLIITVSSYAEPTQDALLTIRRDEPGRLAAVESAGMAVLLTENNGGRVQVYGVPSGNVLTDTVIRPSIVISDTTLQFRPTMSVVVAAQYRPGEPFLWVGGALAALGFLAVLVWPMQRLVVRNLGHWTEFYAYGRGVRRMVREWLDAKPLT